MFDRIFRHRRVVVTGIGLVTPLGVGCRVVWQNLLAGRVGVTRLPTDVRPEFKRLACQVGAFVPADEFASATSFTPSDHRVMSTAMLFGVAAADEALQDAGWKPHQAEDRERTGVAIGMAVPDLDYIGDTHRTVVHERRSGRVSPYFVPKILPNLAPGHVSIRYGFQGPLHSVSTACATGAHAIGDSFRFIACNDADVMVCGGVDDCINPLAFAGFGRARSLSTRFAAEAERSSRPFDADRDGFVIGQGAGVLVLEELEHARRRGADVYCEVLGYGLSGDAEHITAGREDGRGAVLAMTRALRGAKDPVSVKRRLWHVNAHATSTRRGDLAEMNALRKFLADAPQSKPFVASNKGNVGHLLGAAGAVETAFCALAIRDGRLAATANLDRPDPEVVRDVNVISKAVAMADRDDDVWPERFVLKNSFGFGGTNVSLLLGKCLD